MENNKNTNNLMDEPMMKELMKNTISLKAGEVRKIIDYMDNNTKKNITIYNPTSEKINEYADIIFEYADFNNDEVKTNISENIIKNKFIKELTNIPYKDNKEKLNKFLSNTNFPSGELVKTISEIITDILDITTKIITYLNKPYKELGLNLSDIIGDSLDTLNNNTTNEKVEGDV